MFKDKSLREHANYAMMSWPGGSYVTPTISGARNGAPAVLTWATMRKIGHTGYVIQTKQVLALAERLADIARKVGGKDLVVYPTEMSTVCFGSEVFNIFKAT